MDLVGKKFGGFDVIAQKGRGTFGVVYEISDVNKNHFALKVFDPMPNVQVDRAELKRRFAREVRYQSAIKHPNVVSVLLSNLDSDPPYFVMPLADTSLQELIRNSAIPDKDRLHILTDILAGLEALHGAGYKHRDLKPANVLAFKDPNSKSGYRFEISDFGLIAPPENETTTLTATGVAGGTIDYAAPEAMKSLKHVTTRSDIYSVGAIIHDLFIGQRRIPCTKLSGPGEIGKVMEKCTETNQSRRFADVAELRSAVINALLADVFEKNPKDEDIVTLLGKEQLTGEEWDSVDIRIQENEAEGIDNYGIFRAIEGNHFVDLSAQHLGIFYSISRSYIAHVLAWQGKFPFEYCDVVALKLRQIFLSGDVEIKALSLVAMLLLGTTHNRFYVEGMFGQLAGADLDEAVAKRFVTEFQVRGYDLNRSISHWEQSIRSERGNLSSVIQEALKS